MTGRNKEINLQHLVQNYSDNGDILSSNRFQTPQCSAVRQNANQDHLLAGSELSLLQKIAEVNDRMFNSSYVDDRGEQFLQKPNNQMKFSFNKQNAFPIINQHTNSEDFGNKSSTLKDIYFKEFQKQADKIKIVQEERKKIIDNIEGKRFGKSNQKNKENLYGSIKRRNNVEEKGKMNNAYSKSTLHSEALTENKNYEVNNFQKVDSKDEESISLRYLQDSLAKNKDHPPISKIGYLEQSTNRKQYQPILSEPPVLIKQFSEKEEEFVKYLEILFDQLDAKKVGTLDQYNCEYIKIKEQFKIAFGYILIRIKMKNLVLNKEEFVHLGLQTIKELNSEEFNSILKDVNKISTIYLQNKKLEENIQEIYQRRSLSRNKSSAKKLCYSQKHEEYTRDEKHERHPKQAVQYEKYEKNEQERKNRKQQDYSQFLERVEKKYLSAPKKVNKTVEKGPVKKKKTEVSRSKTSQFEIEAALMEIKRNQKLKQQNYRSSTQERKSHHEKRNSPMKLVTFHEESQCSQQMYIPSPSPPKKKRNISESMIREQKRNIHQIEELHEKIQHISANNRRVLDELAMKNQIQTKLSFNPSSKTTYVHSKYSYLPQPQKFSWQNQL